MWELFWRFVFLQYLAGNDQSFMGLIDPMNFNQNLKSLNTTYGTYMLSVGEFDERVILGMLYEVSDFVYIVFSTNNTCICWFLGELETGSKVIDDEISKAIAAYETVIYCALLTACFVMWCLLMYFFVFSKRRLRQFAILR